MEAGISTLGITFGYGTETTAGEKPTTFTQLHRINAMVPKFLQLKKEAISCRSRME